MSTWAMVAKAISLLVKVLAKQDEILKQNNMILQGQQLTLQGQQTIEDHLTAQDEIIQKILVEVSPPIPGAIASLEFEFGSSVDAPPQPVVE